MLQVANTDLFKNLVPKAHNSECQNLLFLYKLASKSVKASLRIFIIYTLGTNGLMTGNNKNEWKE